MIKVKTIQEKDNKFLIERYYKEEHLSEFIVCENYDFESNTYEKGIKCSKLVNAYANYNYLINDYEYFNKLVKDLETEEKKKLDKTIKKTKTVNEHNVEDENLIILSKQETEKIFDKK